MRRAAVLLLLLAACDAPDDRPTRVSAGDRLEAAATATGLVSNPDAPLTGVYAREGDRMCVTAAGRAGVSVDYGEGQRCLGRGTAARRGDRIDVRLGACRIDANRDGDRIVFPAELPAACASLCRGRATLEAVSVERLSAANSEALAARDFRNEPLCEAE